MTGNLFFFERLLRYILGIVLITLALAGGPRWAYVGLFFLFTASFGTCPIYWALRINSRE